MNRRAAAMIVLALTLIGCADQQKNQADLKAGYKSLEQKDYDQAIASADQYLRQQPHGEGTAEALYLKGRAIEEKVVSGRSTNPQADWQAARTTYVDALKQNPPADLDAYIRASLANVAYWQDDYATAQQQWTAAYDRIKDPNVKGWVLYRIGVCQQRQSKFDDADHTFAVVEKEFPNTLPAQRAAEHRGQRAFYVQLATFSSPAGADRATGEARSLGLVPQRMTDAKGRTILRVGPLASYNEAKGIKSRVAATYPDALILP